jgi:hypothetical protein
MGTTTLLWPAVGFPIRRCIPKIPCQRVNHQIPAERYSGAVSKRTTGENVSAAKKIVREDKKSSEFGQNLIASKDIFYITISET